MPLGGAKFNYISFHGLVHFSLRIASRRVALLFQPPLEKHSVTRSYISTQLLSLQNYLTPP